MGDFITAPVMKASRSHGVAGGERDMTIAGLQPDASEAQARARLLVVNEQPAARRRILDSLADFGHEIVVAATPTEAIARLSREPFGAMLADHGLVGGSEPDLMTR